MGKHGRRQQQQVWREVPEHPQPRREEMEPFPSSEEMLDWVSDPEWNWEDLPKVVDLLWARDGEHWEHWEQYYYPVPIVNPAAMGKCLLSPSPPAEEECLLVSPSQPAEEECLLVSPSQPAEEECLLVSPSETEGEPHQSPAREAEPHQSPAREAEPHQSPAREAEQHQSPARGGDYTLLPPLSPGDYTLLPLLSAEGEYLLVPPPPLWEDCLLLPPPPAEGEYLLVPPSLSWEDFLPLPPPPEEGECLLVPPSPTWEDCLLLPPPPQKELQLSFAPAKDASLASPKDACLASPGAAWGCLVLHIAWGCLLLRIAAGSTVAGTPPRGAADHEEGGGGLETTNPSSIFAAGDQETCSHCSTCAAGDTVAGAPEEGAASYKEGGRSGDHPPSSLSAARTTPLEEPDWGLLMSLLTAFPLSAGKLPALPPAVEECQECATPVFPLPGLPRWRNQTGDY
ncbi:UNVERIFIED_CONTAM: hypothetical protein FKN15_022258 [Acipenser sinensis]